MMHFTRQVKPCPSCRLLHFQHCGTSSSTGSVVDQQSICLPSGADPGSPPSEASSVQQGEQGSRLAGQGWKWGRKTCLLPRHVEVGYTQLQEANMVSPLLLLWQSPLISEQNP